MIKFYQANLKEFAAFAKPADCVSWKDPIDRELLFWNRIVQNFQDLVHFRLHCIL